MLKAENSGRAFVTADGAVHLDRVQKALELMRCDAVLEELQACRSNNKQLKAWFIGRRDLLQKELGIRPATVVA